jgi:hypothetical protein
MASKGNLGEFEQLVLLAVLQCGHGAFGLEIRRELETRAERTVTRGLVAAAVPAQRALRVNPAEALQAE